MLSAEIEGGAIFAGGDGTRITDRFNTGGDSFRGFARNGLGPRDFCGDDDEPACTNPPQADLDVNDALGGNYYSVLRLDASFPLGLPQEYGVHGGLFADVGSLWQLDDVDGSMGEVDDGFHLRSSVGVSLFIETPFAPLRFNYAIPIAVRGLRRPRAVPLHHPDPVLSHGPGRRSRWRWRSPPWRSRRARRRRRWPWLRPSSSSTRSGC